MSHSPPDEQRRLSVLRALRILDTDREERFDRIAEHAKAIFDVPMVTITLIDADRQWFKASIGMASRETPREHSFCSLAVADQAPLVFPDASAHPRVRNNPFVTGEPGIRFYAGYPLVIEDAYLGTICILDRKPRDFSNQELLVLKSMAQWVQSELTQTRLTDLIVGLETARSRYLALFHESVLPIATFSLRGAFEEGNSLAHALWDLPHSPPPVILPSEGFGGKILWEALEKAGNGESVMVEPFAAVSGRGQGCFLQVRLAPLLVHGQIESVVAFVEDVTDSIRASEQNQRLVTLARQERERAALARVRQEDFLPQLAHELRNPLNGVMGVAELLLKDGAHLTPELARSLHDCASSLASLVDDTLDFQRITQGRMTLELQPFRLSDVLDSVMRLFEPQAVESSLRLKLIHQIESGFVLGDEARVRQILVNLVSNAVKYTPAGGRVEVKASCLGDRYELRVEDDGVGIASDNVAHLFDSYYQVEGIASSSKQGLGLGLSIVKRLVDLMDGQIGVESELGSGSNFWVTLPLSRCSAPAEAAGEPQILLGNVLVVDDNPFNRRILELQLATTGARVELAEDGQQALDCLKEQAYQIVLMDCQMPVLDGYQATARIRSEPEVYGTPVIIALTGSVTEETRHRCQAAGMNDFLAKPVRYLDLHHTLALHLGVPDEPANRF